MSNAIIFALHIVAVLVFSAISRRLGKTGLTCFVILQSLFANIFVLKQILLFGYEVTCSDVYSVGAIVSLNLLQEDYDQAAAKKAVIYSFFFMVLFVVMSWLHLQYAASPNDYMHGAYAAVFGMTPRIMAASLVTTLISQVVDVQLFGFLKRIFSAQSLLVRSGMSTIVSQAIDTLLFTFLGLYGLIAHPWDIFIVSYLVKMAISFIMLLASSNEKETGSAL